MLIQELMDKKNITKYRLSKESGIAYTTIVDICSGKAQIEKCTVETIYKIAKVLDVTMEELIQPHIVERSDFELYKSNVCHRVQLLGDVEFVIETLERNDIRKYHKKKWYPECFYLLAMLDYISRINEIPMCTEYNDLRKCKLSEPIYPASIIAMSSISESNRAKEKAVHEAIPEFMRFNIVESEIRNVV